jgi:acyl-CoA thioesterase-1
LGDSITAGLGLAAEDALPARLQEALARRGVRAVVRGAGVSGDTTAGGLARLDFSVTPQTRVCVVELGANDFLQSVPPGETKANLIAILKRLRARGIPAVLAAGSTPRAGGGAYGRELTAAFAAAAKAGGAALAPNILAGVMDHPELRQADGLHPNRAGVRILADRLAPAVAQALNNPAAHRS